MSYRIVIKKSAAQEIEGLPQKDRVRVIERIRGLAQNPRPPGCQKLSKQEKYRVRQGRYRILYQLEDDQLLVVVVKVAHREDVYG